jgi:hypothetical protein
VPARRWSGAPHLLKLNTGSGECGLMSGLLINLIIQVISGAIGGNVAAGAAKNVDLGPLGMLIPLLANSASTPDIGSIIGQVAGGGVAGAVLTAIVGAIKNKTA